MRGEITTGGHVNLSTSDYKNFSKIAIGQPIIGFANNTAANLKICFGVFCTGIYQPQYSMNFTGILTYSNGSNVSNAPIKFTVKYLGSQCDHCEGKNWTDSSGKFFVKLDNLPEYMMNQDLNITIYVQSEVEAVYECWYNHSSTNCCKKPVSPPC